MGKSLLRVPPGPEQTGPRYRRTKSGVCESGKAYHFDRVYPCLFYRDAYTARK
jgi:hypothetical protein